MSPGALRTFAATAAILLAAFAAYFDITAGFAALTSDGVRRVDLARSPRALPPIALIDEAGRPLRLSDYGKPSPQATFVALVYVRCQSICRTSAAGQSWLQHTIREHGLEDRVRLLTLSFDPANDTPAVLADYARRLNADTGLWRFATVSELRERDALLKLFDVVVLDDGMGGYSHNAALFLIDREGRLARAYDIDRPDRAFADYLQWAGS